jgi:hypothetical protein
VSNGWWTESWIDRDGTEWTVRPLLLTGYLCEECEPEVPATVEVRAYPMYSDPGSWQPLCEGCAEKLQGKAGVGEADAYVGLRAAL